jgi:hypothetical protein
MAENTKELTTRNYVAMFHRQLCDLHNYLINHADVTWYDREGHIVYTDEAKQIAFQQGEQLHNDYAPAVYSLDEDVSHLIAPLEETQKDALASLRLKKTPRSLLLPTYVKQAEHVRLMTTKGATSKKLSGKAFRTMCENWEKQVLAARFKSTAGSEDFERLTEELEQLRLLNETVSDDWRIRQSHYRPQVRIYFKDSNERFFLRKAGLIVNPRLSVERLSPRLVRSKAVEAEPLAVIQGWSVYTEESWQEAKQTHQDNHESNLV